MFRLPNGANYNDIGPEYFDRRGRLGNGVSSYRKGSAPFDPELKARGEIRRLLVKEPIIFFYDPYREIKRSDLSDSQKNQALLEVHRLYEKDSTRNSRVWITKKPNRFFYNPSNW